MTDTLTPAADLRTLKFGNEADLRRKEKVVAFVDLPGVPEGTKGIVTLVNGWDKWIRYRVLFDNGVDLGSIDRAYLAPVKRYDELVTAREAALDAAANAVTSGGAAAEGGGGDAGGGGGGGDVVVNGVSVPGHLIERARAARARMTGG